MGDGILKPIIVTISGGKDSTAAALHLKEQGLEFRCVSMDTGWEPPETYDYITGELPKHIGPVEIIAAEEQMEAMLLRHLEFPRHDNRFCSRSLKLIPLIDWLAKEYGDEKVTVVNGARANERPDRAGLCISQKTNYAEIWRPIVAWSLDDVQAIHRKHSCPPSPLYIKGQATVGCWPCHFAPAHILLSHAKRTPERIEYIRGVERRIAELREKRNLPNTARYLMYRHKNKKLYHGIDEVLRWASESNGAYKPGLVNSCLAWGLCNS